MRSQSGFTLVELLVALGIMSLMLPTVITSIYQIARGTTRITNELRIQQDIELASSWFTRDLALAMTTDVQDSSVSPFPEPVGSMRVDWIDQTGWAVEGSEAHYVEYTLIAPNLYRNYDGNITIVARYVSSIAFSREVTYITIAMTSTSEDRSVSLSYFVEPRPEGAFE